MSQSINKDLVLREHLALERTRLANERTLLSYIRTGLYFAVAGSTLGHVVNSNFWKIIGTPLIIVGVIIIAWGIARFLNVKKSMEASRKNIGNASKDFIRSVIG
jgi:putative membrane protein